MDKPTCKVVKRTGERGARIDPKGCKVRTTRTGDTGAQDTTITQAGATKLGYNPFRVASEGWDTVFTGVTAGQSRGKLLHNMSFYVQVDPDSDNDWRWVSGSAIVSDELQSENLLGTGHISDLKSGYTVQFV